MNTSRLAAAACFALALALVAAWWGGRRAAKRAEAGARFFTLDERRLLGEAFGANCIWRPCHWLPATAALAALPPARTASSPFPWVGALALVVLAGTGVPITRTVHRCGGTIQGGHQLAASRGGTTSIWNGEPACGAHNRHQSATRSWRYAWRQWGPFSLAVYAVRLAVGSARLAVFVHRHRRS